MSLYVLGSRAKVKDHIPVSERLSILFGAGVLVLFRAGLLVLVLVLDWRYGGQGNG